LRLKRVELIGFKSFMDRTVLDFRNGITTILGPNGCGKSNVVDAVRWVLGEQSAKQLRGEKMEDVIFKGSGRRKPLSVAEVSLVFENTGGRLKIDYEEVAVTRRVTRAGTSDYFLNKTPCRLKDIKDLFYDTGVGNNAYSVIEQEVVGQVLDPAENKVRAILEEGSGIVRYKVKRKEALRKLDLTERDLLRVEDIIDEIGKQVRSLARQVGKARRHQRLFAELKGLEILRAHVQLQEFERSAGALRDQVQALRTEGSGDDAEVARLRASWEKMRPGVEALEEERRRRAQALSQVESELAALEGELLVLREKAQAGSRRQEEIGGERERAVQRQAEVAGEIATAQEERAQLGQRLSEQRQGVAAQDKTTRGIVERYEELRRQLRDAQQLSLGFLKEEAEHRTEITASKTRLTHFQERQATLEREIAECEAGVQTLRGEAARCESHAAGLRDKLADEAASERAAKEGELACERRLSERQDRRGEAADELARAESRHEIAARIAKEYEGYRAGAAAILRDDAARAKVHGALAERLRVEPGYESAFELLFGEDADALVVDGVESAVELVRKLSAQELGRTSFLALGLGVSSRAHEPRDLPGRPALELLGVDESTRESLRAWLGQVRVVESAADAVRLAMQCAGSGTSFLAREGLYVRADGLVRGGAGRRELSIFGRKERVDAMAQDVARLRELLGERDAQVHAALDARNAARDELARLGLAMSALREELHRAEQDLAARRSVLQRDGERLALLQQQKQAAQQAGVQVLQQLERQQEHLGRHGEDQATSQDRLDSLAAEVACLEQERDEAQRLLSESRLSLTRDEGHDRELDSRLLRLFAMKSDLDGRLERLDEEEATLRASLIEWRAGIEERTQRVADRFADRDTCREAMREIDAAIDAKRVELDQVQESMREIAERQRHKSETLHELETELTKKALTASNLRDRIFERYQIPVDGGIEAAYAALSQESLPRDLVRDEQSGNFQLSQVEQLRAERQDRLDKLGPVNFVALDEYEAKKQRLDFLEKQRDDLLQSKEDLLQAIDKINKTARQLFRETFEQVRANFQKIFTTLFEGGEADLVLHRAEDPLEGEVQIVARPKGKRVDSVALLSGGERALTAISLLFSVYLIKPSPFCLLDEVDAPLDDVNVGRFVRLLKEFADRTQFVVITHNKLTMEAADHLYGVTMEERGVSRLVSVSFEELDAEDPLKALELAAARRSAGERAAARVAPGLQDGETQSDSGGNGSAVHASTELEGEA
jgi:chromosome segregation protein